MSEETVGVKKVRFQTVLVALAAGCASVSPTWAAQQVQTLTAVEAGVDGAPFTITGSGFNPALGTLETVNGRLIGTYQAHIFTGNAAPASEQSNVHYDINSFGSDVSGSAGSQVLTGNGNQLTAAPFNVDATGSFSNLNFFENAGIGATPLFVFDVYSSGLNGIGASSDASSFNGDLVLTYTYAVPEPASAGMLFMSCAAILLIVRYRRGFSNVTPNGP